MYYLAVSGFCVAALVGSAIYENYRMKKEVQQLKSSFKKLRSSGLTPFVH
jgi:hypothetical protein